jgi:membrane associated rhomboid family serine protease
MTTFLETANMKNLIRTISAIILTPVMKLTGFRFSRAYRREDTKFHSIVYALIDTVGVNTYANKSIKVLTLSLIASCAIAALITAVLVTAPQYRVNVIDGHITLTK